MSSNLSLRLPKSIHREVKRFAEADGVSMNQFITTAVAEKIASLATVEYLEQRAQQADKDRFHAILNSAPDIAPRKNDQLK